MKVVLQRVASASVTTAQIHRSIGNGLMLLVGIGEETTERDVEAMAVKITNARLFEDSADKMNLSIKDIDGEILSISQFTLYADVRKGNRPSFTKAMTPDRAEQLYQLFNMLLAEHVPVTSGKFGAMMDIHLVNHGPVTVIYEAKDGRIQ